MPKIPVLLLIGVTLYVSAGVAQAQFASPGLGGLGALGARGAAGQTAPPVDDFDTDICADIASGGAMSLDACRSMMMMQQRMQAASSDPNAVRPGDETLSCPQIYDEIRTSGWPMLSQSAIAQNQQAGANAMAAMEQQKADARGYVAGQVALGVGATALGMVPGVGGFARQAADMAIDARAKAFEERQDATTSSIMAQSAPAIIATDAEIGEAIRTNPRYARLMQLVTTKSCPPPTP